MREQLLVAEKITAIEWRDGALYLLDQRRLPHERLWCGATAPEVADAIRQMLVRCPGHRVAAAYVGPGRRRHQGRRRLAGSPAGGCAAARQCAADEEPVLGAQEVAWASGCSACVRRMTRAGALEAYAAAIHQSDREANLTMAQSGLELIRRHQGSAQNFLTHCNAGRRYTGGFGTALAARGPPGRIGRACLCRRNPALVAGFPADGLGAGRRSAFPPR